MFTLTDASRSARGRKDHPMTEAPSAPSVTPIWRGRATLGEGPIWSAHRNRLFFVDNLGRRIVSCGPTGADAAEWPMPVRPCWLVEHANGADFLIGLERAVVIARLEPGQPAAILRTIAWPEPLAEGLRFNDAKADADGRVYCGTMDDAEAGPLGAFHAIAADGTVTHLDHGYTVSNGPAISPDGGTVYHTDSPARTIYAFDRSASGHLSGKRVHIRLGEADGYPDGMTCDAEGGLWVAHWDGARVSLFTPEGRLDRAIPIPASRVTCCVFFGPALDRLAVTTAAHERMEEPLAGALFAVDPGCRGAAAHRYGLAS
jgi:sugar lactone lactonase YvrE